MLININSETYSAFLQEDIIIGSSVTGFVIFGEGGKIGNFLGWALLIAFFVFAFFKLKKIIFLRRKAKTSKVRKWLSGNK